RHRTTLLRRRERTHPRPRRHRHRRPTRPLGAHPHPRRRARRVRGHAMRDILDIYGAVVAEAGPEDNLIVAYWELLCDPRHTAGRILTTYGASPALIHATIAACDHAGESHKIARRAAARNPNTPARRLE